MNDRLGGGNNRLKLNLWNSVDFTRLSHSVSTSTLINPKLNFLKSYPITHKDLAIAVFL